jgi:hypothetical protein
MSFIIYDAREQPIDLDVEQFRTAVLGEWPEAAFFGASEARIPQEGPGPAFWQAILLDESVAAYGTTEQTNQLARVLAGRTQRAMQVYDTTRNEPIGKVDV